MSKIFIEESSLTSIGNAIRAKTGGSANLTVPNGMVAAINSIQTGGDGTEIPTQFTNYATLATIKVGRVNNTGVLVIGSSGSAIYSFKNPKEGQAFRIVWRGCYCQNDTQCFASGSSLTVGGTLITASWGDDAKTNEQGDLYIDVPAEKSLAYLHFSMNSRNSSRNPIIVIDEHIGNGGWVES